MIDTTDYDIAQINYANLWFNKWMDDEEEFKRFLISSASLKYCLSEIYELMAGLGELPVYWKSKDHPLIIECRQRAVMWYPDAPQWDIESITRVIAVLTVVAEKRVKTTIGD